MAKASSLEVQLARVRMLRERADVTDSDVAELLRSKHSIIAAAGAEMAGAGRRVGLIAKLAETFERFMVDGAKTDKGCAAKMAVVQTLCAMDYRDFDLYRRGVKYTQLEASFGPATDTAAELRGRCAVALAECGAPHAVLDVVEVLVDKMGQARVGAARAMGAFGSEEAAGILRLKMLTGDDEPVVLAECCQALLHISREEHEDYIVAFLNGDESAAEDFVMGLMESKDPAMLRVLKSLYNGGVEARVLKAIVGVLAVMRVDGAMEFLLEVLEKGMSAQAKEALNALRVRRGDERLRERIRAVVEKRGDAALMRVFESFFG